MRVSASVSAVLFQLAVTSLRSHAESTTSLISVIKRVEQGSISTHRNAIETKKTVTHHPPKFMMKRKRSLATPCDASFLKCLPNLPCLECFQTLGEEDIDWAGISGMTPCSDIVDLLNTNGYCKMLAGSNKDVFCDTFNSCVIWDEDDDDTEKKMDCSKLKKCEWDGMHENFLGDGICQKDDCYNSAICDYDHGDCCVDDCKSTSYNECGVDGYQCKDPESEVCDSALNPECAPDETPEPEVIPECEGDSTNYKVNKYDTWGDGWDYTMLNIMDKDDKKIYSGTLHDGYEGIDYVCLEKGCYSVAIDDGVWGNEISWELKSMEGGVQLAHGGSQMECNFPIGGNECENTCTGRDPSSEEKEMTDCITNKCMLQLGSCLTNDDCSPCLVKNSPTFCFTNDLYNALVDCAICKCSETELPEYCETGTKSGGDAPKTSCSSQQTLSGAGAVIAYSKCSNIDQISEMETDWDEDDFGTLDTFESCGHEYATESSHGGKKALDCMQLLSEIVTGASGDPEYVKTLATDLYKTPESVCDCAKQANTDSPACDSFKRFKVLLHETLDACQALDEIDCAAWEEFSRPCKQNLIGKFESVDFSDRDQCAYVEDNCKDVGPFPAFRRLDCGKEISKVSWDFYQDYARGCLEDGGNDMPHPAPVPKPVSPPDPTPETPPDPTPETPPAPAPDDDKPTIKPYVPPAKPYVPPPERSEKNASKVNERKRHPLLWMFFIVSLGGTGFYIYRQRQSRGIPIDFARYHRQPQSDDTMDEGLFDKFSAGSFEPPSVQPTPVRTIV